MPRSQGQKLWCKWIGIVTRNTLAKYQSPSANHSKEMAMVKVFEAMPVPKVINSGTSKKVLSQGILMSKFFILTIQNL
jgi:hypothetical protein